MSNQLLSCSDPNWLLTFDADYNIWISLPGAAWDYAGSVTQPFRYIKLEAFSYGFIHGFRFKKGIYEVEPAPTPTPYTPINAIYCSVGFGTNVTNAQVRSQPLATSTIIGNAGSQNVGLIARERNTPFYLSRVQRLEDNLWVDGWIEGSSLNLNACANIGNLPETVNMLLQVVPPTATPSPQVFFQNFKGIIFWAIYNETNSNTQIPLSQALPGEIPNINGSITNYDHRYLMARTILNNITYQDTNSGVGFMRRWGGSIAFTGYSLWSFQKGRVACPFNGSSTANSYDSAAQMGDQAILLWFNGYMECFRSQQPLSGNLANFDTAYTQITSFIDTAINDHVNNAYNPVPNAQYVKHTSSCFVWQRDLANRLTSCFGAKGRKNMKVFCNEAPIGRLVALPNRDCKVSSINPSNIVVSTWLDSVDASSSNQQLGLDTTVGKRKIINLGLYVPDQPLLTNEPTPKPTSGQGCENGCYFIMGNPEENPSLITTFTESRQEGWDRHEAIQNNPDYGYRGNSVSYLSNVVRIDRKGNETWITTVFQQGAN